MTKPIEISWKTLCESSIPFDNLIRNGDLLSKLEKGDGYLVIECHRSKDSYYLEIDASTIVEVGLSCGISVVKTRLSGWLDKYDYQENGWLLNLICLKKRRKTK